MTSIFHALAHETRRRIMDVLKARPGIGVGELSQEFDVTRIAVMNHLAVLEQAGLILSEKEGRTRRLYLNTAPIQMINDRWLDDFNSHWARTLTSIKYAAAAAHSRVALESRSAVCRPVLEIAGGHRTPRTRQGTGARVPWQQPISDGHRRGTLPGG